eukprot:CAMPEP_0114519556 /NCGR_PEP_ID=MMETSP0109-20121206/19077_1 /TAXON_ID=29199 /ORGANISM="Chlorarachnion reptans, Strain CCCM449" /LENGTH=71 /DNA_ID=CAMNT_0001700325 /DNA_START=802 /DNA_END=1013 /DNA_ORIENTATION=+
MFFSPPAQQATHIGKRFSGYTKALPIFAAVADGARAPFRMRCGCQGSVVAAGKSPARATHARADNSAWGCG